MTIETIEAVGLGRRLMEVTAIGHGRSVIDDITAGIRCRIGANCLRTVAVEVVDVPVLQGIMCAIR